MTVARSRFLSAALVLAATLGTAQVVRANECLRAQTPPPPPDKGAVLAVPLDPGSDAPNVVVLEFEQDPSGIFHGDFGETCLTVARNPRTITVAPGGALVFFGGNGTNVVWGAVNVEPSDPPPVILPGGPNSLFGQVEEVWVLDPAEMLEKTSTCRRCDLSNRTVVLPAIPEGGEGHPSLAYLGEVFGANFRGATLSHVELGPPGTGFDYDFNASDFTGATFDRTLLLGAHFLNAILSGATFDNAILRNATFARINLGAQEMDRQGVRFINGTDLSGATFILADLTNSTFDDVSVDGTAFDSAVLYGTTFTSLRFRTPPTFPDVSLGGDFRVAQPRCTSFANLDLVDVSFERAGWSGSGCVGPLFAGSQVRLSLLHQLLAPAYIADGLDLSDTQVLVSASDRKALAGADLRGAKLAGADFLGEPLDLTGTELDGADLAQTNLSLAHLAGATFENVAAAGASFTGADLAGDGTRGAASFAGTRTNLQGANFVDADVSGASFQGADLSGAVFAGARGIETDFGGVIARHTVFAGAHLYGNGQAFDQATDMEGADFSAAVLASDPTLSGGFDFTGATLTNAHFDGAVCVACNFTNAHLAGASFTEAYLPGVVLAGVTLTGASLDRAWLYCGNLANGACGTLPGAPPRWAWPLRLGSGEAYGPVPFEAPALSGLNLSDVTACPSGKAGSVPPQGCAGDELLPDPATAPAIPAPCSASGNGACATPTTTLFDASAVGAPLALAATAPPTWNTALVPRGWFVAFDDGTIRRVDEGSAQIVAGTPGTHCAAPGDACGDGGPAAAALLGTPSGLAVGLDGALYVADSALLRVRRIDPTTGVVTTVAGGGGEGCDIACGDGGPATDARLAAAGGVAVDPLGVLLIAEGGNGVRRVARDGTITTLAAGSATGDVRALATSADGAIYASTRSPDHIVRIDPDSGAVTPVVGTGTSGYNGNTDAFGLRAPGTEVQIDGPAGLAVDLDGKVVFADSGNDLIRAYVPSSGHVIDVVAGVVDDDVPKGGFNGDGHVADQTELQAPVAVTASRGALRLVADAGNRRVRQVGPVAETGLGGPEEPPEENPTSPSDDGACAIAPRPRPSESVALSVLAAAALFRLLAWRRRQS